MDEIHGHEVHPAAPGYFLLSPGVRKVEQKESFTKIKAEPSEKAHLPIERNDESENDEDDDFVVDDDGIEFYVDEDFQIRQVSSPLIVNRTMKDLYYLSKGKYLKLDPDYQRDVVWDETRSSLLIASIIQGYFIPPIIFNLTTKMEYPESGGPNKIKKYYRTCVDGKQRLTSLIKFMDGQIGVWDAMNPPKKWLLLPLTNKDMIKQLLMLTIRFYTHPIINGIEQPSAHLILPEKTKNFFRLRTFCCYEYNELPLSVEENMFQLVQRGMPLTPAEKLRALSTEWAVFAKQYEEDYVMVVNLSKQARASGFRAVVTIFSQICEVMNPSGNRRTNREGTGQTPTLQASPQVLTGLLSDEKPPSEAMKAKFKEVFDTFQKLVDLSSQTSHTSKSGYKITPNSAFDPAPDYLREPGVGHVKTFSPLELLATAILILVHSDSRSTGMLIGDIKEMRLYLRRAHKDLRLNPACWATVWKFIEVDLESLRGGRDVTRKKNASVSMIGEAYNEEEIEEESETTSAPILRGFRAQTSESSGSQSRSEQRGASRGIIQPITADTGFGTVQDDKRIPRSRSLQIASFSDKSENGEVYYSSKKRKNY